MPLDAQGTAGDSGFGELLEEAFLALFAGELAVPRVLASFRRVRSGDEYVHKWPGLGLQRAASYMEGLAAHPFPDIHSNPGYAWLTQVGAARMTRSVPGTHKTGTRTHKTGSAPGTRCCWLRRCLLRIQPRAGGGRRASAACAMGCRSRRKPRPSRRSLGRS